MWTRDYQPTSHLTKQIHIQNKLIQNLFMYFNRLRRWVYIFIGSSVDQKQ